MPIDQPSDRQSHVRGSALCGAEMAEFLREASVPGAGAVGAAAGGEDWAGERVVCVAVGAANGGVRVAGGWFLRSSPRAGEEWREGGARAPHGRTKYKFSSPGTVAPQACRPKTCAGT